MYGFSQIQGTRSKKDWELYDKSVPYFHQESGPCPLDWRKTIHSNVDLVFSNNLDMYVAELPEQHFSVWLFSNPGNKIFFLLKFNEAKISEWNINVLDFPWVSWIILNCQFALGLIVLSKKGPNISAKTYWEIVKKKGPYSKLLRNPVPNLINPIPILGVPIPNLGPKLGAPNTGSWRQILG